MDHIILFGCGLYGKLWLNRLGEKQVLGFSDSDVNKAGKIIEGKKVYRLSELKNTFPQYKIFISTSVEKKEQIRKYIEEMGESSHLIDNPYDDEVCRLGENTNLEPTTIFEGNNFVGDRSKLYGSRIGFSSYVSNDSCLVYSKVGKYSAIGPHVQVVRGQHPANKFVSIHPAFYSPQNPVSNIHYTNEALFEEFRYAEGDYAVVIGSDVWIGQNVSIMEGVTIGDGAIIAAGSVVIKDVAPYTIMAGVPAKKIRDRFDDEEKDYLEKLRWWDKDQEWIKKNACYFKDISELRNRVSIEE